MATSPKDKESKFHFPEWMTQNIGRLSTSINLDEYSCSLLESEGYPSECLSEASSDVLNSFPSLGIKTEEAKSSSFIKSAFEGSKADIFPLLKLSMPANGTKLGYALPSKHLSAVEAIKCEEGLYSSPDSTPCVTPEHSPIPQRKISLTSCADTVQSNPQKWFYLGTAKNSIIPKQLKKKCTSDASLKNKQGTEAVERKIHKVAHSGGGVKLTISNFDINAISPSSW